MESFTVEKLLRKTLIEYIKSFLFLRIRIFFNEQTTVNDRKVETIGSHRSIERNFLRETRGHAGAIVTLFSSEGVVGLPIRDSY